MRLRYALIALSIFSLTSCAFETDFAESETGTGGSMARFTIQDNHLYTVDYTNLNTFDISNPSDIHHLQRENVGFSIETIFPHDDKLFLGARNGMYIYSLDNPEHPEHLSYTDHFWSNDPVVVQGDYAYVTLRNDEFSWRTDNMLQIYDISNAYNPELIITHEMDGPRGLAIDGNKLFICDKNALKIFNVSDHISIELLKKFSMKAIDVIPNENMLYVIAEDGFYNYTYNENDIEALGKISIPFKTN